MQRVAQEKLDDDLVSAKLTARRQLPQSTLVGARLARSRWGRRW